MRSRKVSLKAKITEIETLVALPIPDYMFRFLVAAVLSQQKTSMIFKKLTHIVGQ